MSESARKSSCQSHAAPRKTMSVPGDAAGEQPPRTHETLSNIPLKLIYQPEDAARAQAAREAPGEFPFTRGVHADMYRGKLWTMRMFAGFGSPEDTNRRFHYLLEHGQTGLSIAFDLPTQLGYDSDSPRAAGHVVKNNGDFFFTFCEVSYPRGSNGVGDSRSYLEWL